MNAKVLRVLEYDKVIHMLEQKATSDPGRQLCRDLVPMTDLAQIEQAQTETADALTRIFQKGSLNFGSNKPLGMCLRSLEIGSTLSSEELLRIAGLLENTARVKNFGRSDKDEEQQDSLTEYFHCLEPLAPLSKEIRRCIIDVDEIADDASPALKKIRRSMVLTGEKIHNQLNSMVNGSVRNYLQDAVITTRDGRYCIPVKAEYKGQVPGMVHDQSSTGSTFFIEPAAVVSLNNQLRELEIEEQKEIAVILANLSAEAGAHTLEIAENQRIMTQLDFIFAKASLAMDQNASRPLFNDEHIVRIRQGRHPLLDRKKVVPIDVELGKNFDLLVITGPNTGGKTVCLKTVGLFTLMGQAGLHIPALDRSQLAVFTEVFADIGDEQSIEQSLSTFSSHMTSIVSILAKADADSLCLFDELGAGTDPTEGAALAIAVLNFLHNMTCRTIATTHYSELKVFALTAPGVENACCEFNVETLRPTYRLLIGIPGKSNAFAISRKLGLPDYIIDEAKNQMEQKDESFEDLLANLENSRVTIEKEREEIASYKQEIETLKNRLQQKEERFSEQKEKMLSKAREEAQKILQDAKDTADQTIRNINKLAKSSGVNKELEAERTKLRGKIKDVDKKLAVKKTAAPKKAVSAKKLRLGDTVRVLSMNLKGTVSSLPNAKGDLYVQMGILRSLVNIRDLEMVEEASITGPGLSGTHTGGSRGSGSGSSKIKMSKSFSVSPEVNLIGMTVDEAIPVLDKYLDDAYLAHLPQVRVVHGRGTGALKAGVHRHLKKLSYVKEYRLGEFGEGDTGVTIVTFK